MLPYETMPPLHTPPPPFYNASKFTLKHGNIFFFLVDVSLADLLFYLFCNQVEIRPMMYVALTYDHRLVDGREAVTFLRKIKAVVEDPRVLLLDM